MVHSKYAKLQQEHRTQMSTLAGKTKEYERLYSTLEASYSQLLYSDAEHK
jgi:hypothetical protein